MKYLDQILLAFTLAMLAGACEGNSNGARTTSRANDRRSDL